MIPAWILGTLIGSIVTMISYPVLAICCLAGVLVGSLIGVNIYMPLILRLAGKHEEKHKDAEV